MVGLNKTYPFLGDTVGITFPIQLFLLRQISVNTQFALVDLVQRIRNSCRITRRDDPAVFPFLDLEWDTARIRRDDGHTLVDSFGDFDFESFSTTSNKGQ